eukprot:2867447-Pyramimonas_sp.AAC.1
MRKVWSTSTAVSWPSAEMGPRLAGGIRKELTGELNSRSTLRRRVEPYLVVHHPPDFDHVTLHFVLQNLKRLYRVHVRRVRTRVGMTETGHPGQRAGMRRGQFGQVKTPKGPQHRLQTACTGGVPAVSPPFIVTVPYPPCHSRPLRRLSLTRSALHVAHRATCADLLTPPPLCHLSVLRPGGDVKGTPPANAHHKGRPPTVGLDTDM